MTSLKTKAQPKPVAAEGHQWWQNAVFYEIYPRRFADSNDDGIGDLNGITSKVGILSAMEMFQQVRSSRASAALLPPPPMAAQSGPSHRYGGLLLRTTRVLGNCRTAQTDVGPMHYTRISALVCIAADRLHLH